MAAVPGVSLMSRRPGEKEDLQPLAELQVSSSSCLVLTKSSPNQDFTLEWQCANFPSASAFLRYMLVRPGLSIC